MKSYPRSYGPPINWGQVISPAVKVLLIANTAVFFIQTLTHLLFGDAAYFTLIKWFGLIPLFVIYDFRLWQPFTYMFLHGGLVHILLNMLVLWMFGCDLDRLWGRRRFYGYFFLTGVGAGVVNVLVKTLLELGGAASTVPIIGLRASEIPTIGASGAIYGILMASAIVFPDRQVWLIPFPITLPMRAYVFVIGLIAFFGTLGTTGDNVSHLTHLSGMLVGYFYLRRDSLLYRLRNRYLDWKRRRMRRKFDVYMREHKEEPSSRPDHWVN